MVGRVAGGVDGGGGVGGDGGGGLGGVLGGVAGGGVGGVPDGGEGGVVGGEGVGVGVGLGGVDSSAPVTTSSLNTSLKIVFERVESLILES